MRVNDTKHFLVISTVPDFLQQETRLLQNVRKVTQTRQPKGLDHSSGFSLVGRPKILKPIAGNYSQCRQDIDHDLLIPRQVGCRELCPLGKTKIQMIEFGHGVRRRGPASSDLEMSHGIARSHRSTEPIRPLAHLSHSTLVCFVGQPERPRRVVERIIHGI